MTPALGYVSLGLYIASCVCYAWVLYAPNLWLGRTATLLLGGGIVLQYAALLARSHATHTIPYDDLYGSMSLFAWLFGITYLALEIFHRQRSVGVFATFAVVAWMGVLGLLAGHAVATQPAAHGPLFALHVTLNTWGYAAFALSFILSLVYLVQDRLLRSHRLGVAFWRFPALDVLDRMARSSVYVGLGLLLVGGCLGLVWAHRLSGSYNLTDPKVIITAAILVFYVAYLRLSRLAQWRGTRAATLCAVNFIIVLFSYTFVNLYMTRFHRFF